jgi:hypothetical protein
MPKASVFSQLTLARTDAFGLPLNEDASTTRASYERAL